MRPGKFKTPSGDGTMINMSPHLLDYPILVFLFICLVLWLSEHVGAYWSRKRGNLSEDERADLNIVLGASLTLLALIIGFTFSMATSRYDQRKNYEEEEANAIDTEYFRVTLLPASDAAKARELLKTYVDQRVVYYTTRDMRQLQQVNARTAALQAELWATIQRATVAQPTPVAALVAQGMNDVLNTQGYTQAAWLNRIPMAAWVLMVSIAVCCACLFGYTARSSQRIRRFRVLPLIVSISFFLVADIDSPRAGVIRVEPLNIENTAAAMHAP